MYHIYTEISIESLVV